MERKVSLGGGEASRVLSEHFISPRHRNQCPRQPSVGLLCLDSEQQATGYCLIDIRCIQQVQDAQAAPAKPDEQRHRSRDQAANATLSSFLVASSKKIVSLPYVMG